MNSPRTALTDAPLSRTLVPAFIVSITALLALCVGGFYDAFHFFRAYLFAWLMCLSVALGAMAMVMMHHLTGGRWGWLIRRPGEAAAATLPFVTLAFVPIALGVRLVFPWADANAVAQDEILRHRQVAFNIPFTLGRAAIFLISWSVLGWLLGRWSLAHDRTADERLLGWMRKLSAGGLVVYFITMSLAAVDWIASREVDWYSSTFGVMTVLGQAVCGLAVLIIALAALRRGTALTPLIEKRAIHDLGNLLQTTVVLWAYVSFAQYLVIWSGNMQEDITWFYHRTHGGWSWVGTSIIVLHFGLPFVLLLFQRAKRALVSLATIAVGVLIMRHVDMLWMIAPSNLRQTPLGVHWLDFVAPLALGGLWWICFTWQLGRRPLVPLARRIFVPEPLHDGVDASGSATVRPIA